MIEYRINDLVEVTSIYPRPSLTPKRMMMSEEDGEVKEYGEEVGVEKASKEAPLNPLTQVLSLNVCIPALLLHTSSKIMT